jgi:hypothetical protein
MGDFVKFTQTLPLTASVDTRPLVELVISSDTGFLTDLQHLCQFFEELNTVSWWFLVFDNRSSQFTRIDLYAIIDHFHHRPIVLDDDTSAFVAAIKAANKTRHQMTSKTASLGYRGRNRASTLNRPDLSSSNRRYARVMRVQVRECPICPRQFLTDEHFNAHLHIHEEEPGSIEPGSLSPYYENSITIQAIGLPAMPYTPSKLRLFGFGTVRAADRTQFPHLPSTPTSASTIKA